MAPGAVRVREAAPDDHVAAMNVLDGAGLAVDADRVRRRIAAGDVLVAVDADRVLGAAVLDPDGPPPETAESGPGADAAGRDDPDATHLVAVAVRRTRRDRGVGTALVEAAAARAGRLAAAFDPDVRPFYESLGFAVTGETPDGRLRGVLDPA